MTVHELVNLVMILIFLYLDDFGNLYCYNVNKFMKVFKSRILSDKILNIKLINNR